MLEISMSLEIVSWILPIMISVSQCERVQHLCVTWTYVTHLGVYEHFKATLLCADLGMRVI
jgi:hypothetical protein